KEGIRRRLASEVLPSRDDSVDPFVEQVGDSGSDEDLEAMLARRHDRRAMAGLPNRAEIAQRPVVRLDATQLQESNEELVLALAEPVHRLRAGRVASLPVRKMNTPRCEEGPLAVEAELAIDVALVITDGVERNEWLAGGQRPREQVLVEHLFPRGRVDLGSFRQHAVQIEEKSVDRRRDAERRAPLGGRALVQD